MVVKELTKETIISWSKAVDFHNSGSYIEAIQCYSEIKDASARMYYNQACAQIKLGLVCKAMESLSRAIEKDEHLAVAYFQRGILYLQDNSPMKAIADLEMTLILLRGNMYINYKPLGLHARLSSFQILHNLALANVRAKRLTYAHRMLTEALHDADDLQRKSIQISLEKIDDARTDLIPVMQVSVNNVFTLPKSVTQNLDKKGIVRKAKVVSASDPDDTSAAFWGSKRVRELKQMPTPPLSSLSHLKRFVKNLFRADDSSVSVGSSRPVDRRRRLFQKRTAGSTDKQASIKKCYPECMEKLSPAVGSTGNNSPRGAFVGERQPLNNKKKSSTSASSSDEDMPILVMRGYGSTGDLSELDTYSPKSDSGEDLAHFFKAISKRTPYEKLKFDSKQRRNSLGSVFCDYLNVVGQTLSGSCDVLTAGVTPPDYENDVINLEFDQDLGSVAGNCSTIENKSDKAVQVNIKGTPDETETLKTNVVEKAREDKPHSATRKPRPPPPSYPPPPLPPNIVIYV